MKIARATAEHLEVLAPLFDGYRQFYEQASDLAGAKQFLEARIRLGQSAIFLALDSSALAGQSGLGFTQLYPMFSSVSMEPMWILNDLFVAPYARKRGVGEALIEAAVGFARTSGAKGLQLETAVSNISAQRLYERMGWIRETDFYTFWFRTKPGSGAM